MRSAGLGLSLIALLSLVPAGASARSQRENRAAPVDVRTADTLLARGGWRPRELEVWANAAALADLVWLLRRPAAELGAAEHVLARAALARVPADRPALAARLRARSGAEAHGGRSLGRSAGEPAMTAYARPRASVFRVGALLPDSGDYAEFARSVSVGLEAGLQSRSIGGGRSFEYECWATGDDDPARMADALESSSWRDGVLVGELLSVRTLAVAIGARMVGLPLLSPTATDEAIGRTGPDVFQVGPSGWARGERLARVLVDRAGLRVGALIAGTPERSPLALGFLATSESLGATVEWQGGYSPGATFRDEVRILAAHKLDCLLWDGEPREAEALLREMSRQKVAVRLCGGEGLDPNRIHADARVLLEGVRYVAEEWRLADAEQALLDSTLSARDAGRSSPLHVRGWLAGRAIAAAVAGGALCPEELSAALAGRCGATDWLATHHFLDVSRDGATLPMFVVQRGRAVRAEP